MTIKLNLYSPINYLFIYSFIFASKMAMVMPTRTMMRRKSEGPCLLQSLDYHGPFVWFGPIAVMLFVDNISVRVWQWRPAIINRHRWSFARTSNKNPFRLFQPSCCENAPSRCVDGSGTLHSTPTLTIVNVTSQLHQPSWLVSSSPRPRRWHLNQLN